MWVSEDYPDGILRFQCKTKLFTRNGCLLVNVYERTCLSKTCRLEWDGAEHYIFRLTKQTCAGYEIGMYDF